MPPEALNFRQRAQLTELMDEPCSREVMRDCLRDLARVNRWFLAYRPLLAWLDEIRGSIETEPIRILDVGCGYGDTLRRVERWARDRGVKVELTGLDMNPDSIAIAAEAGEAGTGINWIATDVFAFSPAHRFHLIVSCQFMHHLGDGDVIRFVRWMEENAEIGWFINDLSRAPIPYHLFRVFSRVAGLHPFVQNDGPVSIARAFVTDDWRRLCAAAGLRDHAVEIRSYRPARLCVSRRKPE